MGSELLSSGRSPLKTAFFVVVVFTSKSFLYGGAFKSQFTDGEERQAMAVVSK